MGSTSGLRRADATVASSPLFAAGMSSSGDAGGGRSDEVTEEEERVAREAQGEERERLFEILSKMSKTTVAYQKMCAPRELPLVVLSAASKPRRAE